MIKIGLIAGYGVNLNNRLKNFEEHRPTTPYGKTSSPVINEKTPDYELFIIQRHGEKEETPSYLVNYKANIYALYELGCTHIMSTSVCGSLQEEVCIGEVVIFDQFINLSTHRELSFIDKISLSKLNHSAFNHPFSQELRDSFIQSAIINSITVHTKGTVIAVDGPRQSTRAESNLFRNWKADVINTTTIPEAILAHELNVQYGAISLCTYYDTWRTDILPATYFEKQKVIDENKENILNIIEDSFKNLIQE